MSTIKVTRQELYEMVWKEPMTTLAKKYLISDVGLRKKCKKLVVPIPDAGYWAKVKAGKRVFVKKLKSEHTGESETTLQIRDANNEADQERLERIMIREEIENDKRINLVVPEKLKNTDPLIRKTKDEIYKVKMWKKDDLVCSPSGTIDIRVSPQFIDRALRFMDAMIKAMRMRGFDIANGGSKVMIDEEAFDISFREKRKRVKDPSSAFGWTKLESTGVLFFRVENSYRGNEWANGTVRLEEKISGIIAFIEARARKNKIERLAWEKERKEEEEKERILQEHEDRKQKELDDFKELLKKAKRHDKAVIIRNYADKMEKKLIEENSTDEEKSLLVAWIRKKADWYDPFIEAEDEFMEGVDREELILKKKKRDWFW